MSFIIISNVLLFFFLESFNFQEHRMGYNDDGLQWETKKWESKHDDESTLDCFVFYEFGADRQPWISAFDRRQARQKRGNIRSIHRHVLILTFFVLIVAHHHCSPFGCSRNAELMNSEYDRYARPIIIFHFFDDFVIWLQGPAFVYLKRSSLRNVRTYPTCITS